VALFYCLPDGAQAVVAPEGGIRRDDGDVLKEGLSNDLAVEGIPVVEREIEEMPGVCRGVGEDADDQVVEAGLECAGSELKFSDIELNGDLTDRSGADFAHGIRVFDCVASLFGKTLRLFHGENESGRIQQQPQSVTPFEEGVNLFIRHRLPPVGIDDFNPVLHSSEPWLAWFGGYHGNQIDNGLAAAADRDRLACFNGPDQLRQFVFGFGNTDLHDSIIAI
jgi:hypothetical protein